jgi:hypothetical protein
MPPPGASWSGLLEVAVFASVSEAPVVGMAPAAGSTEMAAAAIAGRFGRRAVCGIADDKMTSPW